MVILHKQRYTKINKSSIKCGLSIKLQAPLRVLKTAKLLRFI